MDGNDFWNGVEGNTYEIEADEGMDIDEGVLATTEKAVDSSSFRNLKVFV